VITTLGDHGHERARTPWLLTTTTQATLRLVAGKKSKETDCVGPLIAEHYFHHQLEVLV
jgi:hypothetical protein